MNFDHVASIYDRMASVVFGSKWKCVQIAAARELNQVDQLLILGGGTGAILEQLVHPEITYVEMSGKMIDQARQRPTNATVKFVNADFLEWNSKQKFDAIYCPFFLDCFDESTLKEVLNKVLTLLNDPGQLHVIDFKNGNWFQGAINRVMVLFFRITVGLVSKRLLPIDHIIQNQGFDLVGSRDLMAGWVFKANYTLSGINGG